MLLGTLLLIGPDGREQEIALERAELRIGSAPDNDLVLSGPQIAPQQARLRYDEAGVLTIELHGSYTGTPSERHLRFSLREISQRRDLAWIGDYVLCYVPPAHWDRPTEPLRAADLPQALAGSVASTDETALLHTLLGQHLASPPDSTPDAATVTMPLIALSASARKPIT